MDEDVLEELDRKIRGLYIGMGILVREVAGEEAIQEYGEELDILMGEDINE